tara:strand:+ start:809 stop:1009 length:201 start_codon:yes stop_codon:yes gene_type:complete
MNLSQRHIIAWASQRVNYLDGQKNYEDSYAVSQEFCEWTVSLDVYPQRIKAATMLVPDFNKEKSYD